MAKASFNEPNPTFNIAGWHDVPNLSNIERKNLENVLEEDDQNSIQIYLRLRPSSKEESNEENFRLIDSKTIEVKPPPDSCISKSNRTGSSDEIRYIFSQVFKPCTSQKILFNSCVLNPVHKFIDGKSCLLFSYGTTNAGKTHTIHGSKKDPGIIPRVLSILFKSIKRKQCNEIQGIQFRPEYGNSIRELKEDEIREQIALKEKLLNLPNDSSGTDLFQSAMTHQTENSSFAHISQAPSEFSQMEELIDEETVSVENQGNVLYSVWVSFLEVYNEQVYDLLVPQSSSDKRVPLKVATDNSRNVFVKGLNHVHVTSGIEAYKVLLVGKNNLQVASTNLNRSSSRSHCVFSIKLIKRDNEPAPSEAILSSFSICDLAGAERLEKTGNTGNRMKETQNINTSLHVLVRCFKTMLENQSRPHKPEIVPYRESKLTQLFHRQLCGKFHEDVIMIVNVNPSPKLFEETAFVLKASAIAKQITRKPVRPKINKRKSVFSTLVFENKNQNTIQWEAVEEEREEVVTIDLDRIYADFEAEKQKIRADCEAERLRSVQALDNMIDEMMIEHQEHMDEMRDRMMQERIRREHLFRDLIANLKAELAELRGDQSGASVPSTGSSDLREKLQDSEKLESLLEKANQEKVELRSEIASLQKEKAELLVKFEKSEREAEKALSIEKELKKSEQSIIALKKLLEEARQDLIAMDTEKSELEEALVNKDVLVNEYETEVEDLNNLLSSKCEMLEAAEAEIEQKDAMIHKLEQEVKGKDVTIETLEDTIDELKEMNQMNVCKHDRQLTAIEKERDMEKEKRVEIESKLEELQKEHLQEFKRLECQIAELKGQLEQSESKNKSKRTNKKATSQWLGDEFKENNPVYEAKTEPRRKLRTRNQTKIEDVKSPSHRRSRSSGSRVLLSQTNLDNGSPLKTPPTRSISCNDLAKNLSKSCRKKLYNANEFFDQENVIAPIKFHSPLISSPKSELKNVKRRLRNQLK
ncbi:unnamed protein product [Bemisia tabaci]|uniref:Kinesin-like protein n=1 Tax=Bemisia tabaci TaxID=7038 RepID=A0A9P0ACR2_BEMTA|nr:unnamed protein product [Bemisia tabaci]